MNTTHIKISPNMTSSKSSPLCKSFAYSHPSKYILTANQWRSTPPRKHGPRLIQCGREEKGVLRRRAEISERWQYINFMWGHGTEEDAYQGLESQHQGVKITKESWVEYEALDYADPVL